MNIGSDFRKIKNTGKIKSLPPSLLTLLKKKDANLIFFLFGLSHRARGMFAANVCGILSHNQFTVLSRVDSFSTKPNYLYHFPT
jgi:hypothetical protein